MKPITNCFASREFRNYWFETGTPTFLVELLRRMPLNLDDLSVPEEAFSVYDPANLEVLPLLVQTGYLTIRDAALSGRSRQYRLGFPNFEIEASFSYWLARAFRAVPDADLNSALERMIAAASPSSASASPRRPAI